MRSGVKNTLSKEQYFPQLSNELVSTSFFLYHKLTTFIIRGGHQFFTVFLPTCEQYCYYRDKLFKVFLLTWEQYCFYYHNKLFTVFLPIWEQYCFSSTKMYKGRRWRGNTIPNKPATKHSANNLEKYCLAAHMMDGLLTVAKGPP